MAARRSTALMTNAAYDVSFDAANGPEVWISQNL
jgi:hypothetical protein